MTLVGGVNLFFLSCLGPPRVCSVRFTPPAAVAKAMDAIVPGCVPGFDEILRHRSGHARVVDRQALCKRGELSVLVNIARAHSSTPHLAVHAGGMQLVATHRHGLYTVQVIEQGSRSHRPDITSTSTLAADKRLLAGTS